MEIKKFILILPPLLLIISIILIYYNIHNLFYDSIILFSNLFLPGWILIVNLKNKIGIKNFEALPLSIVFSFSIITIYSIFLDHMGFYKEYLLIPLFISLIMYIYYIKFNPIKFEFKKNYIAYGLIIFIFIFSFLVPLDDVIRFEYYIGWDPWTIKPNIEHILPKGVFEKGYVGYYTFLAYLYSITDLSIFHLSKYNGPIFLGITSSLIYILVNRIFHKSHIAILSTVIFISNPFLIKRFMMPLREDFTFIFLIGLLFFITISYNYLNRTNYYLIIPIALLLATITISHPLVLVISYGILFLFLYHLLIKYYVDKNNNMKKIIHIYILSLILALLLGLIGFISFLNIINWYIIKFSTKMVFFIGITILIPLSFPMILLKTKKISIINNFHLSIIIILLLGAFYSLMHPLGTGGPVTGTYNPPITSDRFSILTLLLAPLGLFTIIRNKKLIEENIAVFLLFFVILGILNVTNIGIEVVDFRMIIYISLVLSIFGSFAIFSIEKILNFDTQEKHFHLIFILFLLILPSLTVGINRYGWSPYNENDKKLIDDLRQKESEGSKIFILQGRLERFLILEDFRNYHWVDDVSDIRNLKASGFLLINHRIIDKNIINLLEKQDNIKFYKSSSHLSAYLIYDR